MKTAHTHQADDILSIPWRARYDFMMECAAGRQQRTEETVDANDAACDALRVQFFDNCFAQAAAGERVLIEGAPYELFSIFTDLRRERGNKTLVTNACEGNADIAFVTSEMIRVELATSQDRKQSLRIVISDFGRSSEDQ